MVAFSSAVAAVRCAVEMQRTTAAAGELELSVGIDAGEPLPEGDDLYGTPVIVASRLCDAAGPGEILISESTYQAVHNRIPAQRLEPVKVKGFAEPVPVYRIVGDGAAA